MTLFGLLSEKKTVCIDCGQAVSDVIFDMENGDGPFCGECLTERIQADLDVLPDEYRPE